MGQLYEDPCFSCCKYGRGGKSFEQDNRVAVPYISNDHRGPVVVNQNRVIRDSDVAEFEAYFCGAKVGFRPLPCYSVDAAR